MFVFCRTNVCLISIPPGPPSYEVEGNGSEKDAGLLYTVSSDGEKREPFSPGSLLGIDIFADAELRLNGRRCRHEVGEGRNNFTEVWGRLLRDESVWHHGTYYEVGRPCGAAALEQGWPFKGIEMKLIDERGRRRVRLSSSHACFLGKGDGVCSEVGANKSTAPPSRNA